MTHSNLDNTSISSDTLHNRNAHAYLLKLKPHINKQFLDLGEEFSSLFNMKSDYDETIAYGTLYSELISLLDNNIDAIYDSLDQDHKEALDALISAIYHNDNDILISNAPWINALNTQTRPRQTNISKQITQQLNSSTQPLNTLHPMQTERKHYRAYQTLSANFKPQLGTNLPTIKKYNYKNEAAPIEYRFSTQAQRHKGTVRISPLFNHWLRIKASKTPNRFSHIYFNNLGRDRSFYDIGGSKERALSQKLHSLEEEPSLKIAVITLPASGSLLGHKHYQVMHNALNYDAVFDELLTVADKEQHPRGVVDFHISPEVRKALFPNEGDQEKILKELLTKSFEAVGISPKQTLSTSQKQAVWVHFTKFELTNYIINTLQPDSFNFSCKDAIDRGALSSVYYNLHKSFETEYPMSKEEFEWSVDAAAANVKGRGMNFHRGILWNAIDKYVNAQDLLTDPNKSWLVFWRDMNCPHACVSEVLRIRIAEVTNQIKALEDSSPLKESATTLIKSIEQSYKDGVSGQRLLLELLSRTSQLLTPTGTEKDIDAYRNLTQELKVNHPCLLVIAGLAEAFLGVLLMTLNAAIGVGPSLVKYPTTLIHDGLATAKSGFFAPKRTQLCKEAEDLADKLDNKPNI